MVMNNILDRLEDSNRTTQYCLEHFARRLFKQTLPNIESKSKEYSESIKICSKNRRIAINSRKDISPALKLPKATSPERPSDNDEDENKDKTDPNKNKLILVWDVSQTSSLCYPVILRWQPSIFNQTIIYNNQKVTPSMQWEHENSNRILNLFPSCSIYNPVIN